MFETLCCPKYLPDTVEASVVDDVVSVDVELSVDIVVSTAARVVSCGTVGYIGSLPLPHLASADKIQRDDGVSNFSPRGQDGIKILFPK